jgi:cold-inducible RNA-binding protein
LEVKLYVGNKIYDSSEEQLRRMFPKTGTVLAVGVVKDRITGLPKGFAFISTDSQADVTKTVSLFNGKVFRGRRLAVESADYRKERIGGGGYHRYAKPPSSGD